MNTPNLREQYTKLMARVSNWKLVLSNWHLGTRDATDGAYRALQEQYETAMRKNVKLDALVEVLLLHGVVNAADLLNKQIEVAQRLNAELEAKFKGARATDTGISTTPEFAATKERLGFPL